MQFGLATAYELGQWESDASPEPARSGRPEFSVHTGAATDLPFPSPVEETPWSEAVLSSLNGSNTGVSLDWELRPDHATPIDPTVAAQVSSLPAEQVRFRTLPERVLQDRKEARRSGLHWRVTGHIFARPDATSREAAFRLAHLLETASRFDGGNRLVCRPPRSPLSIFARETVLAESELVGLFPPSVSTAFSSKGSTATPSPRLWVGRDRRGGSVGIPVDPGQGRHLLILGETGMGKSSLVTRLAWQATQWGSVILFDPVGDTVREFLAGLPDASAPRVSWVAPAQPRLTLSVLGEAASVEGGELARRGRLLEDIVTALRRVRAGRYVESPFWGPRLEEMLFQALRAAGQWPGASLAVAERLLTPGPFPIRTVPESAREAVDELRRRIDSAPQDGDGARRLLSEITRSEILSRMLDAEVPTWSVTSTVTPGKITVVSGDAAVAGESVARYLLAVILALVWNSLLARPGRAKTFLILDEAQWYAHDSVAEMLRLGRRFNLHVWAATQSLASLPETVRDAFHTNAADVVLFRGDPSDVRDTSRWVPQVAPERVMRMLRGEAAVLIDKGAESHWVKLPPPPAQRGDPQRFVPRRPELPARQDSPPANGDRAANDAPSVGTPGPVVPSDTGPIWGVLKDLADNGTGDSELTVRLAGLRSRWPTDHALADRYVRSSGRFLSSAGALLRTGRDGGGSFWVLSRERLGKLLASRSVSVIPDTKVGGARPGTQKDPD